MWIPFSPPFGSDMISNITEDSIDVLCNSSHTKVYKDLYVFLIRVQPAGENRTG